VDYKEAVRAAQQAEAIVYSIIVVPIEASAGRDTGGEHALIQLSTDTGGKYFYASSLTQLDQAVRNISNELRTQYLLAYYPSQRIADSDFRRIEVQVRSGRGTGVGRSVAGPGAGAERSGELGAERGSGAGAPLASEPELIVRHRTGYYTTKSEF
jgi:hypothetical protein